MRRLSQCGESVGFYEADGLVHVTMYGHWRDTWRNWPRSLPMRDQYFGWREALGLFGVMLFQALPLPIFLLAIALRAPLWFTFLRVFRNAPNWRLVRPRPRLSKKALDLLAIAAFRSSRVAPHHPIRPASPSQLARPNLRAPQRRRLRAAGVVENTIHPVVANRYYSLQSHALGRARLSTPGA